MLTLSVLVNSTNTYGAIQQNFCASKDTRVKTVEKVPGTHGVHLLVEEGRWLTYTQYTQVLYELPIAAAAAAAAAAKLLQSCLTLCDPIDNSPPGSPVPGILQARTLEWVAISFSNAWKWKVKGKSLSRVQLFATPWTAAYQAPPQWDFPGKSTRVGCHCLLRNWWHKAPLKVEKVENKRRRLCEGLKRD